MGDDGAGELKGGSGSRLSAGLGHLGDLPADLDLAVDRDVFPVLLEEDQRLLPDASLQPQL